jgi:hypothetical protein
MAEHAAGPAATGAWGVISALLRKLRYRWASVVLHLEPGGSSGSKPKAPKATGHRVHWWGEIVIVSSAPETIREYHVILTLPSEVSQQWWIGYPTMDNLGERGLVWRGGPGDSQRALLVAGQLPIIPRMPTTVGQYSWILAGSYDYQPRYTLAYKIVAEPRRWRGELTLEFAYQ